MSFYLSMAGKMHIHFMEMVQMQMVQILSQQNINWGTYLLGTKLSLYFAQYNNSYVGKQDKQATWGQQGFSPWSMSVLLRRILLEFLKSFREIFLLTLSVCCAQCPGPFTLPAPPSPLAHHN